MDLQVEINELTLKCQILEDALKKARNEAGNANAQLSSSVLFDDQKFCVRDSKLASHHLSILQADINKCLADVGICQ